MNQPASGNSNSDTLVDIRDVRLALGGRDVLRGLSLSIRRGSVTAIMGGSGCGKTTLLNLMGGRLKPDSGQVIVDGQSVPDLSKDQLFELRKRMALLFQTGALFTDLSVFENVAFPIPRAHPSCRNRFCARLLS